MNTARDVDHEREKLEWKVDGFLRAKGWESTCHTPGSYWMWQRKLDDGRVVLCDKGIALGIQKSLDSADEGEEDDDG